MGDNAGFGGAALDGTLDDVRVYNRALSASEISDLYAAGLALGFPSSGLIHWRMLNETAGSTTTADSAGSATPTLSGTATFTTSGAINGAEPAE